MNSQTANENNKPITKQQKTSENSDSNEILSMTEGSTDEQVAGPSNVRNGKIDDRAESSTTDTAAKNDTLNSNIDEDDAVDDSNIDAPNADAPAEDQTADILKLDIDCFEEAFDYLRFRELVSVGKTCKRLQGVAGYLFHQNYSHYSQYQRYARPQIISTELAYFIPFIRKIKIHNAQELEYFLQTQSKFHRLKQVMMILLDFTEIDIGRLLTMAIWSKLEVLCISQSILDNDFQEILNLCTKLKRLEIMWCRSEYNWFDHKYPTLEYLKLRPWQHESLRGIPRFLELNPNIRKFAITSYLFWQIRDKFISSNIKLDNLAICFEKGSQFQSMCDLLNELHKRGFYTKLQLYSWDRLQQEKIDQLASVEGLNKLHVSSDTPISLSSLTNLDEIYVNYCDRVADLEMLPNNLINLKRIHFFTASFDDIMPFIKRSVEMLKIKVDKLKSGAHFNKDTKVIDLRALNGEREELPDGAKITLYVDEEIYLATKWAFGETDFGLIRLRRPTSFEWIHDF